MRLFRLPIVRSVLLLALFVPSWSTVPRLPLLGARAVMLATPVALYPDQPARRRLGVLVFERGYRLTSADPAFGGFSSLLVDGDRFTLLSDGGNIARFRLDSHGVISEPHFAELPAGPGTGWEKGDRDSESMTRDPATGSIWVGFERANQIWAYAPGLARPLRHAAPRAMQDWPENGGAEAMVRLRDGGFVVLSETGFWRGTKGRDFAAISFTGDPTLPVRRGFRFVYRPPDGFKPTDIAELPDERLLVVNRSFNVPAGFRAVLTVIDQRQIAPGKRVTGRELARFAPPGLSDNFEGVAVVRDADGGTGIWFVSDDNQSSLQQSLLLKFRIDDAQIPASKPARRR